MELDVSKKVRTAIKAKLMELGVHVDEELPDYIMILIANRRSKSQMEDDLGLFLGDNTMKFSNWLHQVLKKLQEVTTSGVKPLDRQSSVDEPESKTSDAPSTLEESTSKKSIVKAVKSVEKSKSAEEVTGKRRHSHDSNDESSTNASTSTSKKLKTGTDDEGNSDRKSSPVRIVRKEIIHQDEQVKSKHKEAGKIESITTSKDTMKEKPDTLKQKESSKRAISPVIVQPLRSLIVRKDKSPSKPERSPPMSRKRRFGSGRQENDRDTLSGRQEVEPRNRSRSRSTSPTSKARKSLRSLVAVVKRHNELNAARDEDITHKKKEVPSSVASVIKATSRPKRDSKPVERGSNKLLFRALADAQRSIASHSISKSAQVAKSKEKDDEDFASLSPPKEKPKKIENNFGNDVTDARQSIRSSRAAVQKSTKSIKDRLGYRVLQRVEPNYDNKHAKFEKKDKEQEDEEYVPTSDDSLKTIVVNVPVSRTAKSRMVTLEDKSGTQGLAYQPGLQAEEENVNRLSIQVKNDSDTSDEDDDDDEELGAESRGEGQVVKKQEQRISSTSADRIRVGDGLELKSIGASDAGSSDNGSQHEEIEIEEYEEVEEDDDEYEYEVVLQEKNSTLPDPDDEMSFNNDAITHTSKATEKSVSKSKTEIQKTGKSAASNGIQKPTAKTAEINPVLSSANSYMPMQDTKFVVTMDSSEGALQPQSEEMDTTPMTDLRQRITRSVVTEALNASGFTPLTSSGFNYNRLNTPVPPPSNCKYWPDCQFKDKCVYPHPKCKYGGSCTKPDCPYKHDGFTPKSAKVDTSEANGKIQCKFFPKCHSMSCQFYHPSPCRFGVGCTDMKCLNFHPGPTMAQQRYQGKMAGPRPMYRPALPAAHLLRWKAPAAENSTKDTVENVSLSTASEV